MIDQSCEMPDVAYSGNEAKIKDILQKSKTIAIVGLSGKPERNSHKVAVYLKKQGYQIVPVNPGQSEIFDEKCYKSISDIPFHVDIVDIFRKPDALNTMVDNLLALDAPTIWLQLGVINNSVAEKLTNAGKKVIMNRCIKIEHKKHL